MLNLYATLTFDSDDGSQSLEGSSFKGYSSRLGAREVKDRMRRILVKVAQMIQEIPAGLFLYDVSCRDKSPYDVGGFSDIHHGTYQGAKVAIKQLRSYLIDDSEKQKVQAQVASTVARALTGEPLGVHPGISLMATPEP